MHVYSYSQTGSNNAEGVHTCCVLDEATVQIERAERSDPVYQDLCIARPTSVLQCCAPRNPIVCNWFAIELPSGHLLAGCCGHIDQCF